MATQRTYNASTPYGTDGYRSDCYNYPFNEVLYINHETNEKAWFVYPGAPKAAFRFMVGPAVAAADAQIAGSSRRLIALPANWEGRSAAGGVSYKYQLNICDAGSDAIGMFMSGINNNCYKER